MQDTGNSMSELMAVPRDEFRRLQAEVVELEQAVEMLLGILTERREEKPDRLLEKFMASRARARQQEQGLEVPWRT